VWSGVDTGPFGTIMRQWRKRTVGDTVVALMADRDPNTGRFLTGHRHRWRPGQCGNPAGAPRPERWVSALRAVADPGAVLDRRRVARALDGLAARFPQSYIRLVLSVYREAESCKKMSEDS